MDSETTCDTKMDYGIGEVIMNIPFMLDNHNHEFKI
jgi:hypothetical protein